MEALRWHERPSLRRPVLIAAFEGWNDGADAASWAARYLAETWSARTFATIDPEDFYDFTEVRPHVRLVDGVTRQVDWPAPELSAASPQGTPHDVVFLRAAEPQLRWRAYASLVVEVAKELGIELVLTLGALLADVAHTQDVPVTGMAADDELMRRLGMKRSRYEGPTGIVGVLHDACSSAGIPTASLWASVPLYVGGTPSPKATLALVERTTSLLGSEVGTVQLEVAAAAYERQVSEVVAEDEDMAAYVRRLEELDAEELDAEELDAEELDAEDVEGRDVGGRDVGRDQAGNDRGDLPSTDALAAEVERFLRDQPSE